MWDEVWFLGFCFKVKVFKDNFKINVKVKINVEDKDKVKGFRAPGATYFLLSEKKVGQESGLPGRQGQSRTELLIVGGFVVGPVVLLGSAGTGAGGHDAAGVGGFVARPMMAIALLVLVSAVTGSGDRDIAPSWFRGGRGGPVR